MTAKEIYTAWPETGVIFDRHGVNKESKRRLKNLLPTVELIRLLFDLSVRIMGSNMTRADDGWKFL